MLDIERVLRDCEMDSKNELQIQVRRGLCSADFLKTFRKPYNAKKKSYSFKRINVCVREDSVKFISFFRK